LTVTRQDEKRGIAPTDKQSPPHLQATTAVLFFQAQSSYPRVPGCLKE